MALSCTLLRTYAAEYPAEPARVLEAVNRRLLADTRAIQFVTVFYGVLDPATGSLVYGNAGHWPPLLLRGQGDGGMEELDVTGGALGMLEGRTWRQGAAQLDPGDLLLAYTDGITEALDEEVASYGEERLRALVRAQMAAAAGQPDAAQAIQSAILADVQAFAGAAPQADDMALVAVMRGPTPALRSQSAAPA
jgi:sigma-B regulation protein RsbU (phosphoserine phosphatase)